MLILLYVISHWSKNVRPTWLGTMLHVIRLWFSNHTNFADLAHIEGLLARSISSGVEALISLHTLNLRCKLINHFSNPHIYYFVYLHSMKCLFNFKLFRLVSESVPEFPPVSHLARSNSKRQAASEATCSVQVVECWEIRTALKMFFWQQDSIMIHQVIAHKKVV